MDDDRITFEEMLRWLKERGVSVAPGTISHHMKKLRLMRAERLLFTTIVHGSQLGQDAEAALKENPAPTLETIIKVFQTLILQLTTRGTADPDLLKLADQFMKTVVGFDSGRTEAGLAKEKLRLQERWLALLENKAAQADATENVLAEPQLTPEERALRIRQIYGRV
jgi:division protein CdvB (Snf7/Vps24/ESCRT-III family)